MQKTFSSLVNIENVVIDLFLVMQCEMNYQKIMQCVKK